MAAKKNAAGQPAGQDVSHPITDAEIERWFRAEMHDSIVSQNTAVFNHVRAAVSRLKNREYQEF